MVIAPLSFLFVFSQLKKPVSKLQTFRSLTNLNMKKQSIIVVGSANVDLNSYCPTLPINGETVLGTDFKTTLGGKGANQAIAAARVTDPEISQIHMICKVGNDAYGHQLMTSFDKNKVHYNTEHLIEDGSHTGMAAITVDSSGENTIVVIPGSNYDLTSCDVKNQLEKISTSKVGEGSIIMTQLEIQQNVALAAMKLGREVGALTILNPAPAPQQLDAQFYDSIDIIIPNETELRKLVSNSAGKSNEELAKELLGRGIKKAVIVTLGEKGAMVVENESDSADVKVSIVCAPEELRNSEYPVVDTVGAGDSFCGSLAVYLQSGLSPADAAVKACGVAGLSVRKRGAQSSYPSRAELPACLRAGHDLESLQSSKTVLTFVTGNKKKLEEVQRILTMNVEDLKVDITNKKLDLPELQGNDPIEIAIEKCKLAVDEIQGPVFIEDTSLCFNALNGMPGVYIKWFLQRCGHEGLNKMLDGFEDRSAYAQTIIAFTSRVGGEVMVFDGRTDGNIVRPRGPLDFGWDPVFEPLEGKGKTYAEMNKDEKNNISHRGRSFAKFRNYLLSTDVESM